MGGWHSPTTKRNDSRKGLPISPLCGAAALTFCAAFVNGISVLCSAGGYGQMTSQTGNAAGIAKHLGWAFGGGSAPPAGMDPDVAWSKTTEIAVVMACYVIGGAIAAVGNGDCKKVLRRRHGGLMLVVAAVLSGGVAVQRHFPGTCYPAATWAVALGIVNGCGAVYDHLRITHCSGALTDVGVSLGNIVRGQPQATTKLMKQLLPIACFIAGGWTATAAYTQFGVDAVFGPAAILALVGMYLTLRHECEPPPRYFCWGHSATATRVKKAE